MEKTQVQRWDMFLVMNKFSDTISDEIKQQMPDFTVYQTLFKDAVREAGIQIRRQRVDRTGYQDDKAKRREELAVLALDVSMKARSYAKNTGNGVLFQKIYFTKTSLTRLGETAFAAATQTILDEANEHALALLPYGVTALKILELSEKQELYEAAIPTPQTGINTKKAATTALKIALAKGDVNLVGMDTLVRGLQVSEPVFYTDYFIARRIGRARFYVLSLRGAITDLEGAPLSLVRISCPTLKIKRRASKKGQFAFKHLKEGEHFITFSRAGYKNVVVRVDVFSGVRVEIVVVMEGE